MGYMEGTGSNNLVTGEMIAVDGQYTSQQISGDPIKVVEAWLRPLNGTILPVEYKVVLLHVPGMDTDAIVQNITTI